MVLPKKKIRKITEVTMNKDNSDQVEQRVISYWYLFRYEYCPVCGAENRWKERIYDRPKPKDRKDRYIGGYMNCYCEA